MSEEQKSRILMVDDNPEIREVVNILLSGEGYEVREASNGREALEYIKEREYDLIILDVMMPGLNGYQTCMEIREGSNAPVLFLSAKSQVEDKTLGFSSGGDDYLPKPFSYNELIGRVKALMRRYQVYKGKKEELEAREEKPDLGERHKSREEGRSVIQLKRLKILEAEEQVLCDGKVIELTDIEFSILHMLACHRRQVLSAQQLYEAIWQEPYYYGASNTVMVHIRNLRNKIEQDPHNPEIIKNIWGKGYRCD